MSAIQTPTELHEALEHVLGPVRVTNIEPHPLRSSCPLLRIQVIDSEGEPAELVMKDLGRQARHAMPARLRDAGREIAVYREVLAGSGLETAAFLGSVVHPPRDRYWLFLESVAGTPLWQTGGPLPWVAAARWLAGLHACRAPTRGSWMHYDAAYYDAWLPRASRLSPGVEVASIEAAHARAVRRLTQAEPVFIHGDFYPSNVLVRSGSAPRVCPLDFELAGLGAGVLDLAALVTGLDPVDAAAVLDAYADTASTSPSRDELAELLLCARLHLAIRWLGWLPHWRVPAHQRFDWATEAHAVADQLEGWR